MVEIAGVSVLEGKDDGKMALGAAARQRVL